MFNIVKNNYFFVVEAFYVLYMNYLFCFRDKKHYFSSNFEQKNEILNILYSEIITFLKSYNEEENLKNNNLFNIGDILLNLNNDPIILYLKKRIDREHIDSSLFSLKKNMKLIYFPNLINIINNEILIFIWYVFNMKEEEKEFTEDNQDNNDKNEIILNFKNFNEDIISFFF